MQKCCGGASGGEVDVREGQGIVRWDKYQVLLHAFAFAGSESPKFKVRAYDGF